MLDSGQPAPAAQSAMAEIDALYRAAPIGLCMIDRSLRFVRINERLAQMNGVPVPGHVGRTVRDVVPALADQIEPVLRRVLDTRQAILGVEVRGHTLAGSGAWVGNYVPLLDASGDAVGINVSVEDVSALRRLEATREREAHAHALAAYVQLAREEERNAVAREVHDELGQALTAARLAVKWATRHPSVQGEVHQRLDELETLLAETMKSVRRICSGLRPPLLEALRLTEAIRQHVRDFEATAGIPVQIHLPGEEPDLPAEVATALFRILLEALTNVSRHAHATRVEVSLSTWDKGMVLRVHDDGNGISTESLADWTALGLRGMRERAAAVGGNVVFRGSPESGTTVTVNIPLRATPVN
jgi:PAS domain S-box-containing protein